MKKILVIGGGIAGLEASKVLSQMGYDVTIVEQTGKMGGKLNQWDELFPDNQPASKLLLEIQSGIPSIVQKYLNTKVVSVQKNENQFKTLLSNGEEVNANAILVSTGFDLFNARKKEEYGYGIYRNIITSADLEEIWSKGEQLKTSSGKIPKRMGMIHCVGSRDEKMGNTYCSKVCCITAIKQAIELKEKIPECEIYSFYMDLQLFGKYFDQIYKKAQSKHEIQFIRGRLSECFENQDSSVMLKVEDTLLGKPLRLNVDVVVLMVGMVPSSTALVFKEMLDLKTESNGFIHTADSNYNTENTNVPGIFVAGACTGPKTIKDTINEARAAATQINSFLNSIKIKS